MAACGSLQHMFDNLLPENQALLETLSWNQIKTIEQSPNPFTEIFGELHLNESPIPSLSSLSEVTTSSSSSIEININHKKINHNEDSESLPFTNQPPIVNHRNRHKSSDSFSSLSSESLQLCTEGLGFESSEDLKSELSECWQTREVEKEGVRKHPTSEDKYCRRRSRVVSRGRYPPPISCIGRVFFRSYKTNGRFVLEEISIPKQEFFRAYREDGRLKLQLIQPHDDEFLEEDYDDDGGVEDNVESVAEEEKNMEKEMMDV
ncbi:hypothetical protein TanjilG_01316 [Lupinus angustifolius]|uniref:FAF domain-containing protein n=1 Tax=Lupinus angustifolius TaxID=3871 RepID=A0A4P1REY7_LUPAN|nr:PREDICTED: protein FAF-like, chloroplastic [Lupinus angustifolius]OIW09345.1 hypothetical protein TanjilG_01316 [Lupinus angustifolius]